MNIHIKYFASIREAIGANTESVPVDARTIPTVAALRDHLIAKGTPYSEALARGKSVRMALAQTMCDENAALADGCEVAFFPPVTGG